MNKTDYFKYITEEIHTVVMATVDDENLPVTCVIDIMDWDEGGLYFLTAKGKGFYERLKKRKFAAFSASIGKDTLSSKAVSVRGKTAEVGEGMVDLLINKNPYMNEIYPTSKSKTALTVFKLYDGVGEWFDLSKKPIERETFIFGGNVKTGYNYYINEKCTGCGKCSEVCPQGAVKKDKIPYVINNRNCLHCGNCERICPISAVERRM